MASKTSLIVSLIVVLVGILSGTLSTQGVEVNATVYIRSDGRIDPPTVPISSLDSITYTFNDDIYDSIVIERDNIVVNGTGHVLQGMGIAGSKGILLTGRNNITISNMKITAFHCGIYLHESTNTRMLENNITGNWDGIYLRSSSNNFIVGNNITANNDDGILIAWSSNYNNIVGNNIANNNYGIYVLDSSENSIYHNNFSTNTKQVHSENSANLWSSDYPSGGNYWSDHNPPDEDKDKIGDIPYIINENNVDMFPLVYPYGFVSKPDVNEDGTVNIIDIAAVAAAFGSEPGDERWNPMTDMDMNEIVNIIDIASVARDFG